MSHAAVRARARPAAVDVRLAVVDSGWAGHAQPGRVTGDRERVPGHGTAVAMVLATLAPTANVRVYALRNDPGSALARALSSAADIVVCAWCAPVDLVSCVLRTSQHQAVVVAPMPTRRDRGPGRLPGVVTVRSGSMLRQPRHIRVPGTAVELGGLSLETALAAATIALEGSIQEQRSTAAVRTSIVDVTSKAHRLECSS